MSGQRDERAAWLAPSIVGAKGAGAVFADGGAILSFFPISICEESCAFLALCNPHSAAGDVQEEHQVRSLQKRVAGPCAPESEGSESGHSGCLLLMSNGTSRTPWQTQMSPC
jgi:hypothetical protein